MFPLLHIVLLYYHSVLLDINLIKISIKHINLCRKKGKKETTDFLWVHFQDKYGMTKSTTISSESFCQSIYLLHHMHPTRIPNVCWYLSVLDTLYPIAKVSDICTRIKKLKTHHTRRIRLIAYLAAFCLAINKPSFTWLPNLESCMLYTNKKAPRNKYRLNNW